MKIPPYLAVEEVYRVFCPHSIPTAFLLGPVLDTVSSKHFLWMNLRLSYQNSDRPWLQIEYFSHQMDFSLLSQTLLSSLYHQKDCVLYSADLVGVKERGMAAFLTVVKDISWSLNHKNPCMLAEDSEICNNPETDLIRILVCYLGSLSYHNVWNILETVNVICSGHSVLVNWSRWGIWTYGAEIFCLWNCSEQVVRLSNLWI